MLQLNQLAKDTGLKLQQVNKWHWDIEKKNEKLHKDLADTDLNMKKEAIIN